MAQKHWDSTNSDKSNNTDTDARVLELLSQRFPDISSASTEIINLEAILNLPKGTEHFVADIHGEHEAFRHIIKNASGHIRMKVNELFGNSMRDEDIRQLCTLIYYPTRKLAHIKSEETNLNDFYQVTLHRLVKVLQNVSSKYTRSKVRKALPKEFAYIIEEMLHEDPNVENKQTYYTQIIETIISTGQADQFIKAICNVIQRLTIDQLHILGDIYDRGQGAHIILDTLLGYRDFDIQWGNHDALWMGAAAGNVCCIANVLRISLRYDNMQTLEDGYGINLVPLVTFAMDTYGDESYPPFEPKVSNSTTLSPKSRRLTANMHKSISIIQFKLEAALIDAHPEWNMEGRKLLHRINFEDGTIDIDGKTYKLKDSYFPTIDPADPYKLTTEEQELIDKLVHSFSVSDKLKTHIGLFLSHGGMYSISNGNLMFHASMPLNEDGTLKEVQVRDKKYKGIELYHQVGMLMRSAFNPETPEDIRKYAIDYYYYIWCGPDSPLFDKAKMTTFERYLIAEKEAHHEQKGFYYKLRTNPDICNMILDNFNVVGEHRHIINGHVPVKAGEGENPVKADGMLMVIDGGFSKAYHNTTGIAGYTLIYHSKGIELAQHEPFVSADEAIRNANDIVSTTKIIEMSQQRMRVRDTDKGAELQSQIDELRQLLRAYRLGIIKEHK